jgi:non-heme chloroperoxidase
MIEADWRDEMRNVAVPTLLIHGDVDATFPIDLSSRRTVELVPNSRLEVYENAGHGLYVTHADRLNNDLIQFCDMEA